MLNLGELNFGIGANVDSLRASVEQLNRFSHSVDQIAAQTNRATQSIVNNYARQETAVRAALQQVLNYQRAVNAKGDRFVTANPQLLDDSTVAFQRLTNAMTRGELTALQFNRAQDRFRANLQQSQREFRNLASAAGNSEGRIGILTEALRNLESASVLAVGPLSGIGSRIRALGAISNRSTVAVVALFGALTAGAVSMGLLASGAVRASRAMDAIRFQLEAATGSMIIAEKNIAELIDLSDRLGTNFATSAAGFTQLAAAARGTTLEGEPALRIFEALSTAGRALRLTNEQLSGSITAMTQIISKNTVQAEELRGQLAERIPGAVRLAAKALGVTTEELDKLLRSGSVTAEELLPKLAEELQKAFGPSAERAAGSLDASIERLNNSIFLFFNRLDDLLEISDAFQASIDGATASLEFLTNNLDLVIAGLAAAAAAALGFLAPQIVAGVITLATAMRGLAAGILAVNVAMNANPYVALGGALIRIGLAASAAAVAFIGMRSILGENSLELHNVAEEVERYIDTQLALGTATEVATEAVKKGANERIAAIQKQIAVQQELIKVSQSEAESAGSNALKALVLGPLGIGVSIAELIREFKRLQEVEGATEQVTALQSELDRLQKALEQIASLETGKESTENVVELGTKAQNTVDKIRSLSAEVLRYKEVLDQINAGDATLQTIANFESLNDAIKDLEEISPQELAEINKVLQENGYNSDNAADALAQLSRAFDTAKDAVDEYKKVLEKSPEAIANAQTEIDSLIQRLQVLQETPLDIEAIDQQQKLTDQVDKFRRKLEEAGVAQEKVNDLTAAYGDVLQQVTRAEEQAKSLVDERDERTKEITKATDKVGELITSFHRLQQVVDRIKTGDVVTQDTIDRFDALNKAYEKLEGLSPDALEAVKQSLADNGFAADSVVDALAELILQYNAAEQAVKDFQNALDKGPEALDQAQREIGRLAERVKVLRETPDNIDAFDAQRQAVDTTNKMRKSLEEAGVAQDTVNQVTGTYYDLLLQQNDLETEIANNKKARNKKGDTELENTLANIQSLINEYTRYGDLIKSIDEGSATETTIDKFEALNEAFKALEGLKPETLAAVQQHLAESGFAAGSAEEALALLNFQFDLANEKVEKFKKTLDSAPEALAEAEEAIERLRKRLQVLTENPMGIEEFDKQQRIVDQVDKFREALEKAGVAQERINQLTLEYKTLLEITSKAEEQADRVGDAYRRAGDAGADAFADLTVELLKGKNAIDSLRDAIHELANDLLELLTKTFVRDPISKNAGGFLQNLVGNLFGGGGAPTAGAGGSSAPGFLHFGGPRALGGDVDPGQEYLVGEMGPEKFTPFAPGEITPTEDLSASAPARSGRRNDGMTLQIFIDARGADAGVEERLKAWARTELAPQVIRAATTAVGSRMQRDPKYGK